DFGFDGVFARQIDALGTADDVLIAISTSGSSRNILAAVDAARRKRVAVVALLGEDGPLGQAADVAVRGPSRDTQIIQQVHLAVEHLICQLVEQAMYPCPSPLPSRRQTRRSATSPATRRSFA